MVYLHCVTSTVDSSISADILPSLIQTFKINGMNFHVPTVCGYITLIFFDSLISVPSRRDDDC